MKTRLFTNWRTSLLGGALLVAMITLLSLRIITGGEFLAILPTILGLLYVPDNIFKEQK
ncbi:MAG: hypothetical protein IH596_07200 [Bacteroidales bacterium]|nr:hypothetical protein [Bacteroidales bacterium]